MTTDQLHDRIADLSTEDRYALIDVIWESLASEEIALTDEQRAELDRRVAAYERDPRNVIPWEQIQEEIEKDQ